MPVRRSGPTAFATRGDSGSTRVTGSLYVGDAGEAKREEIDLALRGQAALELRLAVLRGNARRSMRRRAARARPRHLLEYARDGSNCAVIGGVVVRDGRLPALAGRYLYGDFCTGRITQRRGHERRRYDERRPRARGARADELRGRRSRPGLCHVAQRRRLPARPEALDLSSASPGRRRGARARSA